MANFFEQFHEGEAAPKDNFFAQFHSAVNAEKNVPGQISLPGIGKPSLIGMAKSLWSGVTLPRDVAAGQVDPLSDQGIGRSLNLAGAVALGNTGAPAGALGTGMVRPAIATEARTTPQELIQAGGQGFKEARASEVAIDPQSVFELVNRTRTGLANEGKPPSLAPGANATVDELKASAERAISAGQPISANDLVAYRQTLTGHTKTPSPNSAAAGQAKSIFDDWLKTEAPTLAPVLEDAVANSRVGFLGKAISDKADRATYGAAAANSGMNIENRLRQSLVSIVSDERKLSRYSPEVQSLMKEVVNGTKPANALRKIGNILGGGGGLAAALYGMGGLMAHPFLAAAPVVGYGVKTFGNRQTLGKLDRISQMAMQNSPLMQGRMAAASAAPLPAAVPIGGLLGSIARNPQLLPFLGQQNLPTATTY